MTYKTVRSRDVTKDNTTVNKLVDLCKHSP